MGANCYRAVIALLLAVWLPVGSTGAAPFLPTDDSQILEAGLPNADPRIRQMRRVAAQLADDPGNLELAMDLAARQLAMGVAEADPRLVGYAQGTLARWGRADPAPAVLRVLRARILQAQHNFPAATVELQAALRDAPDSPQALIVLASVEETVGNLDSAKDACARFAKVRPGLAAVACVASIASQTGDSDAGYASLKKAAAGDGTTDPRQLIWPLTVLGEIAARRDDPATVEHFGQVLGLDPRNVYALTVYSDYLLDHGRASEVTRLLTGFERVDALYLRIALAAQALGDPKLPTYRADLAARFTAARRQGDVAHFRDMSRFALQIEHAPSRALDFAQLNWDRQKTPYDARVLLEAAIASRDTTAAGLITAWTDKQHLEDRAIMRLRASAH